MLNPKIADHHLTRQACIYIRQSTPAQVRFNQETVVHYWIEHRIVSAAQRKPNTPYAITIDDATDRRLREWVANSGHLRPSSPTQTV